MTYRLLKAAAIGCILVHGLQRKPAHPIAVFRPERYVRNVLLKFFQILIKLYLIGCYQRVCFVGHTYYGNQFSEHLL